MEAKSFLLAKVQGKRYMGQRLKRYICFQEQKVLVSDEPIDGEEDMEIICIYQDEEKFKKDIEQHKKKAI